MKNTDPKILEKIKQAYEEKRGRKTNATLCKEIGISASLISKVKNGKKNYISPEHVKKIVNNTKFENDKDILAYITGTYISEETIAELGDFYLKKVRLDKLLLWIDNPRIKKSNVLEQKSIEEFKSRQPEIAEKLKKITNNKALVDNMLKEGYMTGKYPYVVSFDEYFIVYEGNRRIFVLQSLIREFESKKISKDKVKDLLGKLEIDDDGNFMIYVYAIKGNYEDKATRAKIATQVADFHATGSDAPWDLEAQSRALIAKIEAGFKTNQLSKKEKMLVTIGRELELIEKMITNNYDISEYFNEECLDRLKTDYDGDKDEYSDFTFTMLEDITYSVFMEALNKKELSSWLGYNPTDLVFEHKHNFFQLCLWSGIIKCEYLYNGTTKNERKKIIQDARGEIRELEKTIKNKGNCEHVINLVNEYYWYRDEEEKASLYGVDIINENMNNEFTLKKTLHRLKNESKKLSDSDFNIKKMDPDNKILNDMDIILNNIDTFLKNNQFTLKRTLQTLENESKKLSDSHFMISEVNEIGVTKVIDDINQISNNLNVFLKNARLKDID